MITPGDVACPKCGEDRPTLIHEIIDPRGARYVCMVCSCEFGKGSELSIQSRNTMKA
jgi:transposase-like protein